MPQLDGSEPWHKLAHVKRTERKAKSASLKQECLLIKDLQGGLRWRSGETDEMLSVNTIKRTEGFK